MPLGRARPSMAPTRQRACVPHPQQGPVRRAGGYLAHRVLCVLTSCSLKGGANMASTCPSRGRRASATAWTATRSEPGCTAHYPYPKHDCGVGGGVRERDQRHMGTNDAGCCASMSVRAMATELQSKIVQPFSSTVSVGERKHHPVHKNHPASLRQHLPPMRSR